MKLARPLIRNIERIQEGFGKGCADLAKSLAKLRGALPYCGLEHLACSIRSGALTSSAHYEPRAGGLVPPTQVKALLLEGDTEAAVRAATEARQRHPHTRSVLQVSTHSPNSETKGCQTQGKQPRTTSHLQATLSCQVATGSRKIYTHSELSAMLLAKPVGRLKGAQRASRAAVTSASAIGYRLHIPDLQTMWQTLDRLSFALGLACGPRRQHKKW